MNKIFTFMLLCGIAAGAAAGRMGAVSSALLQQCQKAVELSLSLMGRFCMWGGLMAVAQKAGKGQGSRTDGAKGKQEERGLMMIIDKV